MKDVSHDYNMLCSVHSYFLHDNIAEVKVVILHETLQKRHFSSHISIHVITCVHVEIEDHILDPDYRFIYALPPSIPRTMHNQSLKP